MAASDPAEDKLRVALPNDVALIRVCGRGSFKISPALKQFGLAVIEKGCHGILFDMDRCVGMDSTFMGVLAGLAYHLDQKRHGRIVMINLSPKTRGLLTTLGLDQVIQAHESGALPAEWKDAAALMGKLEDLDAGAPDQKQTAETMLEAHEQLVQVSPENYPRFKDVLTFLREDLKKISESG
jgi:anti-sigma B factor antagonist